MGITIPDSADNTMISTNPNSVPVGKCEIRYGSKNIYSETIKSTTDNDTKIATATRTYVRFEKTSVNVENI